MAMKKDAMMTAFGILAVIGITLFLLQSAGYLTLNIGGQAQVQTGTGAEAGAGEVATVCSSDTQADVTFRVYNKYIPTSDFTGTVYVKTDDLKTWQAVTAGSSATFNPGDKLTILAMPTDGYAVLKTDYVVPCKSTDIVELGAAPMFSASRTMTFWNSAGEANTAQALSPGDVVNVKFQADTEYRHDYGNKQVGYNILVVKANKSLIDDIVISGLQEASASEVEDLVNVQTGYKYWYFKFPVIESNNQQPVYTMTIDVDDTNDPTTNDTIEMTLYDTDYAIDSITGDIVSGAQDNDGNNLGLDESVIAETLTIPLS